MNQPHESTENDDGNKTKKRDKAVNTFIGRDVDSLYVVQFIVCTNKNSELRISNSWYRCLIITITWV